eukprot:TRINITY_DN116926_c0_g1_i1.p1 TRINITY_DN116926_c0_g1~~TRINITY_DN116926_c0_g1_i1.p1  ORF type:complete len:205 (-),score=33.15 TRINITY_DN116926_c0_g1_i1:26-640(-)
MQESSNPAKDAEDDEEDQRCMERLLRHLHTGLRVANLERAEFALDRSELDARLCQVESRLSTQQLTNQMLLRRVQMLEQALQEERFKREVLLQQDSTSSSSSALHSSGDFSLPELHHLHLLNKTQNEPSLEDCIRARRVSISARSILKDRHIVDSDLQDQSDEFGFVVKRCAQAQSEVQRNVELVRVDSSTGKSEKSDDPLAQL